MVKQAQPTWHANVINKILGADDYVLLVSLRKSYGSGAFLNIGSER